MSEIRGTLLLAALALALASAPIGCGGGSADTGGPGGRHGGPAAGGRPGRGNPAGGNETSAAVPVEVQPVERRTISSYIETNGTLEAENEVDILARISAPIVELHVEEGDRVTQGQLLARLDQEELRAQLEIARVGLGEKRLAYERAKTLQADQLISPETFEQARSAYETARAQLDSSEILLGYTEIRAPFSGRIVRRYVNFAEQTAVSTPLFRISDFDPLLCPIQVPERELPRLRRNQRAYLTVESYPQRRFDASVLRISPVIDAATGTVKVTLKVLAGGKLRPGMFARVFVETETRDDALVVPKSALSLESIGNTLFVVDGDKAARREVVLGFREGDLVEIVSGVIEGESIVVVGQDGLTDATPIQILKPGGDANPGTTVKQRSDPDGDGRRGTRGPGIDLSGMSDEQLAQARQRMRQRGMSEAQIDERIRQAAEPSGGPSR